MTLFHVTVILLLQRIVDIGKPTTRTIKLGITVAEKHSTKHSYHDRDNRLYVTLKHDRKSLATGIHQMVTVTWCHFFSPKHNSITLLTTICDKKRSQRQLFALLNSRFIYSEETVFVGHSSPDLREGETLNRQLFASPYNIQTK